jgi:hypothetical protein
MHDNTINDNIIAAAIAEYHEYERGYKPLVDTGRKPLPLTRYPNDLDFSKTVGGTEYIVTSRFAKSKGECLLGIVQGLCARAKTLTNKCKLKFAQAKNSLNLAARCGMIGTAMKHRVWPPERSILCGQTK